MAWKVIGFMEGKAGNARYPQRDLPVYGPLPRKVWVREAGKKNKIPRGYGKMPTKRAVIDDATDRAKAAQYAFWLAKRDGIDLPVDAYAVPQFTTLRNPVTGKMEKRCMFVLMRVAETTLDLCKIDIPNWDWFPAEPKEETLADEPLLLAA